MVVPTHWSSLRPSRCTATGVTNDRSAPVSRMKLATVPLTVSGTVMRPCISVNGTLVRSVMSQAARAGACQAVRPRRTNRRSQRVIEIPIEKLRRPGGRPGAKGRAEGDGQRGWSERHERSTGRGCQRSCHSQASAGLPGAMVATGALCASASLPTLFTAALWYRCLVVSVPCHAVAPHGAHGAGRAGASHGGTDGRRRGAARAPDLRHSGHRCPDRRAGLLFLFTQLHPLVVPEAAAALGALGAVQQVLCRKSFCM